MKKNCLIHRRFAVCEMRIQRVLTLAAIFTFLFLYPVRSYATMPVAGISEGGLPMESAAQMPQPGMEAGAELPQSGIEAGAGMSQPGTETGAVNAVAFPGIAEASFGPSPVTVEDAITVIVCVAVVCAGVAFSVFFRRNREIF